jgi:hypothetical protein
LTGDVTTHRISVEDGAILKGSIQVKSSENKSQHKNESQKQQEAPKALAATCRQRLIVAKDRNKKEHANSRAL